jgi:hypothetical protein
MLSTREAVHARANFGNQDPLTEGLGEQEAVVGCEVSL